MNGDKDIVNACMNWAKIQADFDPSFISSLKRKTDKDEPLTKEQRLGVITIMNEYQINPNYWKNLK